MPFRIRVSLIVLGLLVAVVLVAPLAWPLPPLTDTRSADDLAGAGATWIRADGVRLHARIAGDTAPAGDADRPAIVFVHGFASQLDAFVPLQDALARDARTVAYDRPGFGLSERPAGGGEHDPYGHDAQVRHVLAALDRIDAERGVIVGSSAGAAIALRTALAHPDRVAGLVLIGPELGGRSGVPAAARPLLRTPQAERLGPVLMRQLGGPSGEALLRASFADPSRLAPELIEAQHRSTSVHGWDRALWEVVQAGRAPDPTGRLDEVEVPVLVLAGSADPVVPPALAADLADALPAARYEEVPRCGHLPHAECPQATADRVRAWSTRTGLAVGAGRR